jgi:hypothetical protein
MFFLSNFFVVVLFYLFVFEGRREEIHREVRLRRMFITPSRTALDTYIYLQHNNGRAPFIVTCFLYFPSLPLLHIPLSPSPPLSLASISQQIKLWPSVCCCKYYIYVFQSRKRGK